jgi:hypothetical protein
MRLKRVCWSAANILGAAVLVLLLLDPGRPMLLIFVLLGVGVVLMVLLAFLPGVGECPGPGE